jgi:PAS domain S-box-containing protein
MRDERKNKAELIEELKTLRKRISELEEAKETLQKSGEKWRSLAETAPSFILTVSRDGTIQFVNRPTGGLTREQSIGTKVYEYVEPGQCDIMRRCIEKVFQTGKPGSYEILGVGSDGKNSVWYETNLGPIIHDGKVVAVTMVSTDITERKKAVEEINKLAMFLSENPNPVLRIARDGTVLYANEASSPVLETWGIKIGQSLPEAYYERIKEALNFSKTSRFEFDCYDGRIFLVTLAPVVEQEYLNAYGIDITERKRAEKVLEDSEERLRLFMDSATEGFALWDSGFNLIKVNETVMNMFSTGTKEEDVIGKNALEIVPDLKQSGRYDQYMEVIKTGKSLFLEDIVPHSKFGNIRIDVKVFRVGNGLGMITNDITERKKIEEALRQNEERYRSVVEDSPGLLCSFLPDGEISFVNTAYCEYFDKTREELVGSNFTSLIPEESRQAVLDNILSLTVDSPLMTHEHKVIATDGQIRWHRWTNRAFFDDRGHPVLFQSFGEDITEHKKIDEALQKNKRWLEYLVSSNPAVIYTSKASGDYGATYISGNVTSLTGYEAKDFVENSSFWINHIHPDDKQRILDGLPSVFEKGYHSHEYRFLYKDGSYQWMLDEMRLVRDEQGNPLEIIGYWINITDRKKAEDALSESEEQFRSLLQTAPNVILFLSADYRILEFNTEAEQIYSCKREEALGKSYLETFLPESARAGVAEDIRKVLAGKTARAYENTIKCADGIEHVFMWNMNRVLDKQGSPMGVIAAGQDITERKRSEEALAESEEKYRTLVESAGDSIATIDINGVFLFVNKWMGKDMGGKPEEFLGKTMWDLFPKEIAERQAASVQKVIETKKGLNLVQPTEIQGQLRWYNTKIEPLRDKSGEVSTAMIIARDVDEIKRAEEKIQRLSSAVDSSINGIAIADLKGDLIYTNKSFLKMWRYEAENKVLGKNAVEFWQIQDDASKVIETLQSRESWVGEMTALRKDGSTFEAQISASRVANTDGSVVCMMASFLDITESKQKEDELRVYREQMARAEELASLGTLSATVAHELTQPLTVIRLSLENALEKLQATSSPETITKKLKDSLNEASNINSIVERFRSFARKSTDKNIKEVDLKTIAERIINLLKENARRARVVVRFEGMDELPSFYSNEKDLEQLFFALIDNTIHAADGKEPRRLVISSALKGEHIELRFADNCGGIAPENLDKIFEPFFTTKPTKEGTGLGLCIVQDIVSRAGGKIHVESKFGEGSTFIVTLRINE